MIRRPRAARAWLASIALAASGSLLLGSALDGRAASPPVAEDPPLTQAQIDYRAAAGRVGGRYGSAERIYYRIAVREYPRKRCALMTRRFRDRVEAAVDEAATVVPPPEIADLHHRLVAEGEWVLKRIDRAGRWAARGKLRCGNPMNEALYGAYIKSDIDELMEALARLGYLPSGE